MDTHQRLEPEPKHEYESDLDYWLRFNFGGQSSGRQLKRVVAQLGAVQLCCGTGLVVIAGALW